MSTATSPPPLAAPSGASITTDAASETTPEARARNAELTGAASQRTHPLDLAGRAVLLATDGSPGAIAGSHVALALATTYHAVVHVVSVIDTSRAPIPPPLTQALAIGDTIVDSAVHAQQEQEVRGALSAATGQAIEWPVRIRLGTPASAIAREARRIGAVLVIVGLRRHSRIDRTVNDETALNVMRNARCPVLGVVPGTTALPVRVLAAMDFSETSLLAARAARAVVGDGAVLVLAYVLPLTAFLPDDGERVIHDLGVQAGFARTARELGEQGINFDHVVLHHALPRPTAEILLEYADGAKSDLIAAGSARHGRLDRWMMGSVSTDLVRDGRRSVLIVPPRDALQR